MFITSSILVIVFRSVVVYIFILIAIRFFGKQELAQLSVIDLVFILLISNSVQNAMVGQDTSLFGGLVAALALFGTNYILKKFFFSSSSFRHFVQGEPIMLVYHGNIERKHLQRAQLSEEELMEAVREHGVATIQEVDLAILETDGNISILSNDFTHRTKKKRVHKTLGGVN